MIIVADASPLLSFAILGELQLLERVFKTVIVTKAVYDEIATPGKPHSEELEAFLRKKVKLVKNELAVRLLLNEIDLGEAESIILAIEKGIKNILIDDYKGRKTAQKNGLIPVGTIGVLLEAKRKGLIKEIKPYLDLLEKHKRRIGAKLYERALQLANEV